MDAKIDTWSARQNFHQVASGTYLENLSEITAPLYQ